VLVGKICLFAKIIICLYFDGTHKRSWDACHKVEPLTPS